MISAQKDRNEFGNAPHGKFTASKAVMEMRCRFLCESSCILAAAQTPTLICIPNRANSSYVHMHIDM